MIARLAGMKGKLVIAGVVLALAAGAAYQWRTDIVAATRWAVGFDAVVQALEDERADREAAERLLRQERAVAERRQERIDRLMARERTLVDEIRQRGEVDDEYKDWSRERLPDDVIRRHGMRDGTGSGNAD